MLSNHSASIYSLLQNKQVLQHIFKRPLLYVYSSKTNCSDRVLNFHIDLQLESCLVHAKDIENLKTDTKGIETEVKEGQ